MTELIEHAILERIARIVETALSQARVSSGLRRSRWTRWSRRDSPVRAERQREGRKRLAGGPARAKRSTERFCARLEEARRPISAEEGQ